LNANDPNGPLLPLTDSLGAAGTGAPVPLGLAASSLSAVQLPHGEIILINVQAPLPAAAPAVAPPVRATVTMLGATSMVLVGALGGSAATLFAQASDPINPHQAMNRASLLFVLTLLALGLLLLNRNQLAAFLPRSG